ncbi:MAG: tetratricopeptide repeat protein [Clostridia bacterium]|nr:tetratricopeptide repeat protein [Clostridia bacterium]
MIKRQDNLLFFNNTTQKYRELAEIKAEKGDYLESLGFLFTALKNEKSADVYADIACNYAEMGLYITSNEYWYKYLSICSDKQVGFAYEQLAINFFYMDNFNLSGYYFHQKLSKDGFISQDNLDEDVLNFFNDAIDKRPAYHVAYPFERADYSFEKKLAKHAITSGEYNGANRIYNKIPMQCMNEEDAGEYAFSLFLSGDEKGMKQVCKDSLITHGENVTAYCNLSSLYFAKGDKEKSQYYYKMALGVYTGKEHEVYKIATCAMEQGDHQTANQSLARILSDRTYDVTMRFLYGITQLNLGKFQLAEKTFSEVYRTLPNDKVMQFYAVYSSQLSRGGKCEKNYLPLEYILDYPTQILRNNKKLISEMFTGKISLRGKGCYKYKDVLEWGLKQPDYDYAKKSVCVLSTLKDGWAKNILLDSLMDKDVNSQIKQMIIGMIIIAGYKERFCAVLNDFFVSIKPRKLIFEDKVDGDIYLAAYAVAVSRLAYWNIDAFEKVGFSINKIYKKLNFSVVEMGMSPEELATVAIIISKIDKLGDSAKVCKYMEVSESKVKSCLQRLKGDKQ